MSYAKNTLHHAVDNALTNISLSILKNSREIHSKIGNSHADCMNGREMACVKNEEYSVTRYINYEQLTPGSCAQR